MKKELSDILSTEYQHLPYRSDLDGLVSDLIDFYEDNRAEATEKFRKLLEKYNYNTIPGFSEYELYPTVTLFHSSGDLEFWAVIDYEGDVTDMDEEIGTIIGDPPFFLNNDKYNIGGQDEIYDWHWKLRDRIVFVWLTTIWQNIKGYDYGILVATLENNSCRRFIFNDLAWDRQSVFSSYNDRSKPLGRHFDRDLTILEINGRVRRVR